MPPILGGLNNANVWCGSSPIVEHCLGWDFIMTSELSSPKLTGVIHPISAVITLPIAVFWAHLVSLFEFLFVHATRLGRMRLSINASGPGVDRECNCLTWPEIFVCRTIRVCK